MAESERQDDADRIRRAAQDTAFAGRYELGAVLGRGCAGVVFRATDRQTGQPVAIKFLPDSADLRERFELEAQLLTQFHHPNVVRVFEFDRLGAYSYLVMEFLAGGTLRSRLALRGGLTLAETVGIALDCLAGLQACHHRGIVHRDMKPENILFSGDDQVKIADLGIAKLLKDEKWKTQTGAMMGTPRYMSPEQVTGDAVGPAADIYSVGVILYEVICGRPPFDHDAIYQLLKLQVEAEPPPLAEVAVGVPPELCALVHRALAKKPGERPASVEEFSASLHRVLTSLAPGATARPSVSLNSSFDALKVSVSGVSVPTLVPGGVRKSRWQAALTVAVVVLGMAGWTWHVRRSVAVETRRLLDRFVSAECLAVSADGKALAAGGEHGDVILMDPATGTAQKALDRLPGEIKALVFSPDGTRLIAADNEHILHVSEVATGRLIRKARWPHKVLAAAFGPDGKTLITAMTGAALGVWDPDGTADVAQTFALAPDAGCAGFSGNAARLAVGAKTGMVHFYELGPLWLRGTRGVEEVHLLPRSLTLHRSRVRKLALSSDGKLLVTAGGDRALRVTRLDLAPPQVVDLSSGVEVDALALSTTGPVPLVAAAFKDRSIALYDVATGKARWTVSGPEVESMTFLDGRLLVGGKDSTAFRDLATGREIPAGSSGS